MTEDSKPASNKAPQKSEPDTKSSVAPQGPATVRILAVLKIILAMGIIVLLLAAGWLGWMQWQKWAVEADSSERELANLRDAVDTMQQQLRLDQEQQSQRSLQLQQLITDLQLRSNTQGRRLAELGSTTRSDWLLAEAIYLTRLANQRLQTERRTKNSLALLGNADLILQELDDPDLTPARSALAADITALRLVGEVDVEGVFLELSSLVDSIDRLSVLNMPAEPQTALQETTESGEESSVVESVVATFGQKVARLIRVRQRNQPIEPILQPREEAVVRQNIRLMLEQAQSALLREQQVIYRQSIAKAQSWLAQYFQLNPSAQVLSERLAELSEVQVVQQLPNINTSLQAIETAVALRQSRLVDEAEAGSQE